VSSPLYVARAPNWAETHRITFWAACRSIAEPCQLAVQFVGVVRADEPSAALGVEQLDHGRADAGAAADDGDCLLIQCHGSYLSNVVKNHLLESMAPRRPVVQDSRKSKSRLGLIVQIWANAAAYAGASARSSEGWSAGTHAWANHQQDAGPKFATVIATGVRTFIYLNPGGELFTSAGCLDQIGCLRCPLGRRWSRTGMEWWCRCGTAAEPRAC